MRRFRSNLGVFDLASASLIVLTLLEPRFLASFKVRPFFASECFGSASACGLAKTMKPSTPFAHRNGRTRRAFTLVELLVVVAIIAALIGILLPAVQAARAAARRTQSASNLRQVGLAMGMFCDTHKGKFPQTSHTGNEEDSWIYTVAPFMENVDEIRICPEDPKGGERLAAKLTSYVLNTYLTDEPATLAVTNRNKLQATSKTVVCFVLADHKPAVIDSDHVHNHAWFTTLNLARGLVMSRMEADIATKRFAGGTHLLYADWRVDLIPEATLAEWAVSQKRDDNFTTPK